MIASKLVNTLPSAVESIEREAWIDLYKAAPSSVKKALGLRSALLGDTPVLAGPGIPISEFNRAFVIDDATRPDLEGAVKFLRENAVPDFALQIAAKGETSDVRNWAVARGFSPHGNGWSKMARDLAATVPDSARHNEALELITDPDCGVYGETVVRSFGLPESTIEWFAALVRRPGWITVVAKLGGEAVGSAALYVRGEWAWFGIGGTVDSARRQGIQSTLIRERVNLARMLGVRYLTAETGRPEQPYGPHTSRDNLLRSGFTEIYCRSNYKTL
ncbi:GNAT family N-acetyltransferase [Rhizobium leguminosarum]|uniref:GNAT family N-acetyltransferase n=1 Tax=Rhizobium leguminosarum TaxID=384 RepID=UPI001C945646|nr:GNAT family N-acetyltransferase [Rhizobium leguminosarum]MBY5533700.1 GNAT family N-acetyltransferase [Rhizobium leguminosarum]